jgi:hypothetical protein
MIQVYSYKDFISGIKGKDIACLFRMLKSWQRLLKPIKFNFRLKENKREI